tara:strand:+ start:490 stop:735 length:246 start_codon:yes stop_codon:yes gene_type:complete
MLKKEILELIERKTASAWKALKWDEGYYGEDSEEAKKSLSVWVELYCLEGEAKMTSKAYKKREERLRGDASKMLEEVGGAE